jgi:hypothetical protein
MDIKSRLLSLAQAAEGPGLASGGSHVANLCREALAEIEKLEGFLVSMNETNKALMEHKQIELHFSADTWVQLGRLFPFIGR